MNKLNLNPIEAISIRVDDSNPNHHLWNNNGTWWLHYTVYPTPVTSERRRRSLRTNCLKHARLIRDKLFGELDSDNILLSA